MAAITLEFETVAEVTTNEERKEVSNLLEMDVINLLTRSYPELRYVGIKVVPAIGAIPAYLGKSRPI